MQGILVNGETDSENICEYIPPHPKPTQGEVLVEDIENDSENATQATSDTWFLVVSMENENEECRYDEIMLKAFEAGYSSVIFRNIGSNDTIYTPSNYSTNSSSIFGWSVGDSDGFRLQYEFSYPDS